MKRGLPSTQIRRVLLLEGATPTGESIRSALDGLLPEASVHVASNATQAHLMLYSVRPDLALLDLNAAQHFLPYISRQAFAQDPPIRLVLVAGHEDDDRILPALRAGASGYLLRHAAAEVQMKRLRAALLGIVPLEAPLARQIVRHCQAVPLGAPLTPDERELLVSLATGETFAQVATRTGSDLRTLAERASAVCRKLDLPSAIDDAG